MPSSDDDHEQLDLFRDLFFFDFDGADDGAEGCFLNAFRLFSVPPMLLESITYSLEDF